MGEEKEKGTEWTIKEGQKGEERKPRIEWNGWDHTTLERGWPPNAHGEQNGRMGISGWES
jgi:hypothetical protein